MTHAQPINYEDKLYNFISLNVFLNRKKKRKKKKEEENKNKEPSVRSWGESNVFIDEAFGSFPFVSILIN